MAPVSRDSASRAVCLSVSDRSCLWNNVKLYRSVCFVYNGLAVSYIVNSIPPVTNARQRVLSFQDEAINIQRHRYIGPEDPLLYILSIAAPYGPLGCAAMFVNVLNAPEDDLCLTGVGRVLMTEN